jgi:hypothetical protein
MDNHTVTILIEEHLYVDNKGTKPEMLTLSVDNKIAVQKDAIRRQPT